MKNYFALLFCPVFSFALAPERALSAQHHLCTIAAAAAAALIFFAFDPRSLPAAHCTVCVCILLFFSGGSTVALAQSPFIKAPGRERKTNPPVCRGRSL